MTRSDYSGLYGLVQNTRIRILPSIKDLFEDVAFFRQRNTTNPMPGVFDHLHGHGPISGRASKPFDIETKVGIHWGQWECLLTLPLHSIHQQKHPDHVHLFDDRSTHKMSGHHHGGSSHCYWPH